MGCGTATRVDLNELQEILSDSVRYRAYCLASTEPDYALIHDFQANESRVVKVELDPLLDEYSIHISHPLFFVAGGVIRGTTELSANLWITSAGTDVINMSNNKVMSKPRKTPFIISLKENAIYIIGGYEEEDTVSKVCDKFNIGEDSVENIMNMNFENDLIIGLGTHIYALGNCISRTRIEVFDTQNDTKGWVPFVISENGTDLDKIKNFAVLPKDDLGEEIIIFGGSTKSKEKWEPSKKIFIFDLKSGKLILSKKALPNSKDFLLPTTTGNHFGFALSKNYTVYKYSKMHDSWIENKTNALEEIESKKLILKK